MEMPKNLKVVGFEASNVRKIIDVYIKPNNNGLTVIGGKNNAGKTTIIDVLNKLLRNKTKAIHNMKTEGSVGKAQASLELSNGWKLKLMSNNIKLTGKGVPEGSTAKLLKEIFSDFALDIPKFMEMSTPDKIKMLLKSLGAKDELETLKEASKKLIATREVAYQAKQDKARLHKELPFHADAPADKVSAQDLINQQEAIMLKNAENNKIRANFSALEQKKISNDASVINQDRIISELESSLAKAKEQKQVLFTEATQIASDIEMASKSVATLKDESTDELKASLNDIELINAKVTANLDKDLAKDEEKRTSIEWSSADTAVKENFQKQKELLSGLCNTLEGLEIKDDDIYFQGFKWEDLSTSSQIKASIALLKSIDPSASLALIDKLENLDPESLVELGVWAEAQGMELIGTMVTRSNDSEEAHVIFEDGEVIKNDTVKPVVQGGW